MGCGTCGCNQSKSIVNPSKQLPIEVIIVQKITWLNLHSLSQFKHLIPQSQINQINNYLAANKQLPNLSVLAHKSPAQSDQLLSPMQRSIWKILIMCNSSKDQKTLVNGIKFNHNIDSSCQILQNSFNQISLDINRTFPQYKNFNRSDLQKILRNLTNHFAGVGYTQGMNFYCAFLLMCGFSPEETFYIFVALFQKQQYLFIDIFGSTFRLNSLCLQYISNKSQSIRSLNLSIDQPIKCASCPKDSKYLNYNFQNLAKLLQLLQQNGISPHLYSFSWILTIFLYTIEIDACVLIWDYMIKSGKGICTINDIALLILCDIGTNELKPQLTKEQSQKIEGSIKMMEIIKGDIIKKKYQIKKVNQIIQVLDELKHIYQHHQDKETKTKIKTIFCQKQDIYYKDLQLKQICDTDEKNSAYQKYILSVRTPANKKQIKADIDQLAKESNALKSLKGQIK